MLNSIFVYASTGLNQAGMTRCVYSASLFFVMAEAVGLTTPCDQALASNVISAKRIYTVNIMAHYMPSNTTSYQSQLLISTTNIEPFTSGLLIINLYDYSGTAITALHAYRTIIPVVIIPNMSKFAVSVFSGRTDNSFESTTNATYASALFETSSTELKIYSYTMYQAYLWLNLTILILA